MFDLSTFLSLRHDYANSKVRKIIYFHENQLAYPTRQDDYFKREFRDFQYGYIQILSSLVADRVCFNSNFNRQSFLDGIHAHFKNLPKNQKMAKGSIENKIYAKSEVLYYPIQEGKFGAEKLSTPHLAVRSRRSLFISCGTIDGNMTKILAGFSKQYAGWWMKRTFCCIFL